MSKPTQHSRRKLLQLLSAVPFLPLGAQSLASTFPEAPRTVPKQGLKNRRFVVSSEFSSMPAPSLANPSAMATTTVNSKLTLTMNDGSQNQYALSYHPFFITGDRVPNGNGGTIIAGGYYNIKNEPIIDSSVIGKERQFFSDCPDGTSLLRIDNPRVDGIRGNPLFAVVQFEYTTRDQAGVSAYGMLPSPIAVLSLDQDPTSGKLSLVKYHNVDTSSVHGLWITCGASLSPWGTHLSSEEYEPDAHSAKTDLVFRNFSKNLFGDETRANPYHYGHLPEVSVNTDGSGFIKKHYCLGRISHELVQVMPDNRTVLMGDDATNSGLFMFVADIEKDLSAGSLYVAKIGSNFSLDPKASAVSVKWIHLGHAHSREIEELANSLAPVDIMTVLTVDPQDTSFEKIYISGKANWVKLKPGMEKAAAFLETHRYAYIAGGSMGFTKMEGTTVNIKDKIAYSALQNCIDSMVKHHPKGWNAQSNISLEKPVNSGAILAHELGGRQHDTNGQKIDSEWVPIKLKTLLVGEDINADELGNRSNPEMIANPDNLKFSEKMRTLFIGEDSSGHVNNFVWAYNIDTKKLSRIMSMPSGAEATGLHVVDDLNGWTYIMSNFQHPGEWSTNLHGKVMKILEPHLKENYKDRFGAAVGYLTADRQTNISPRASKKTQAGNN